MKLQVFVLAAGRSTRFGDPKTKLLHEVGKTKILRRVLDNLRDAGLTNVRLIVGHQRELIQREFPDYPTILQEEQLGTGHAVGVARGLNEAEHTLVVFGDKPIFRPQTIREFVSSHLSSGKVMTIATVVHPKLAQYSEGWGTVVRENGRLMALRKVENTAECDAALYLFLTDWLWANIRKLQPHDNHGRGKVEYYLPDLVEIAVREGVGVNEYRVKDFREATGINTMAQLEEAEAYLRE